MRWFCGFISDRGNIKQSPKPNHCIPVWNSNKSHWISNDYTYEIFTLNISDTFLAIIGRCLADRDLINRTFSQCLGSGNFSDLMNFPGNYNLIVSSKEETFIYSDISGFRPIFYHLNSSWVVYSSYSLPLKQLIRADVNREWVNSNLIGQSMIDMFESSSPFLGIQTVPPGFVLIIRSDKLVCERYWDPPEPNLELTQTSKWLRRELMTAVQGRVGLGLPVSCDLSGGLDSTALSALSAQELSRRGETLSTFTFGNTIDFDDDDQRYAKLTSEIYSNISSTFISKEQFPAAYSNLKEIPMTDEPVLIACTYGRFKTVMEKIKISGSQLHMSGDGGDEVLYTPLTYLADLWLHKKHMTCVRHSFGWSRARGFPFLDIFKNVRQLSKCSYSQWLLDVAYALQKQKKLSRRPQDISWTSSFPVAPIWMTRESVELFAKDLQNYSNSARPYAPTPGQHTVIANIKAAGRRCRCQGQLAEEHGISLEFPFIDANVINACVSTRVEDRTNPFVYKPLLLNALEGAVSPRILSRSTKGNYSVGMYDGIKENLSEVSQLMSNSILADLGLLNKPQFLAVIKQFTMGFQIGLAAFNTTIAMELWLQKIEQGMDEFWEAL